MNEIDTLESHRTKGFLAREDLPRWRVQTPINWAADPFRDNNWRFLVSSWRIMDPWLTEYFKEQDPSFLAPIFDIVTDWYQYHHNGGKVTPYTWYDMATGIRALRLAFLVREIKRGAANPQRMDILLQMVSDHLEKLRDESAFAMNNHGIFQAAGLIALAAYGDRRATDTQFAIEKLGGILELSFTNEGVHKEHSPFYHRFVRMTLSKFKEVFEVDKHLSNILRAASHVEPWLGLPDNYAAAIGDTDNDKKWNPLKSIPNHSLTTVGGFQIALRDLRRSGYVVCRSLPNQDNDFMLIMTGMKFSDTHKHSDDLSFIYYNNGEKIFIDPGKYKYEYSEMRDYFVSASAHNTVSLEDSPILPIHGIEPFGSSLHTPKIRGNCVVLSGAIKRTGLFSQSREISITPRQNLTIKDELKADEPRRFVSSLHLHPDMELERLKKDLLLIHTKNSQTLVVEAPGCEIDTLRGEVSPPCGWYSPSYGSAVPTSVMRAKRTGKSVTIIWNIRHR